MSSPPGQRPPGRGPRPDAFGARRGAYPTWPRVGVVVAVLLLTYFGAKNCQDEQIQTTEEDAIELAREQVDFEPTDVQIRLLRQGIDRQPKWFVSLSIPLGDPGDDVFKQLAVVRIDARSGEVESVEVQEPRKEGDEAGSGDGTGPAADAGAPQP